MQKAPTGRYAGCTEVIDALRPFAPAVAAVRTRPTMTIPRLKAPPAAIQPAASAAKETPARSASRAAAPLPPPAPSAQRQSARKRGDAVNASTVESRTGYETHRRACSGGGRVNARAADDEPAPRHFRRHSCNHSRRGGVVAAGFARAEVIAVLIVESPTRADREAFAPLGRLLRFTDFNLRSPKAACAAILR